MKKFVLFLLFAVAFVVTAGARPCLARTVTYDVPPGGTLVLRRLSVGDWSVGLAAHLTDSDRALVGAEAILTANLRLKPLGSRWFLRFAGGPGEARFAGEGRLTGAEFVGLQHRFGGEGWLAVSVGPRHRFVYWAGGALHQALLGELQADATVWQGLYLSATLGFGQAWFQREDAAAVSLRSNGAATVRLAERKLVSAGARGFGLGVGYRF